MNAKQGFQINNTEKESALMGMKNAAYKHRFSLAYAFIFLFVFGSSCMSPMAGDDFSYAFSWYDDSRIHSIRQIIESMAVHYVHTNARVVIHGIASLLLMLPKIVFNTLNSLCFVFLLILFVRISHADNSRKSVFTLIFGFLLIFCFTPRFSEVFLWLVGSVNYSWAICFLIFFLYPYIKSYLCPEYRMSKAMSVSLLPIAFIAGSLTESFSPATICIAACLCVLIWAGGRKFPLTLVLAVLAAAAGFLFLLCAPSNSGRADSNSVSVFANNLVYIISVTKDRLLLLYLIYAVFLAFSFVYHLNPRIIILSIVLVLGGILSLGAYSLAVYFAYRHMAFAAIITTLAILILCSHFPQPGKTRFQAIALSFMSVLFLLNFALASIDIFSGFIHELERKSIIKQALEENSREVYLEPYIPFTDYAVEFFVDGYPGFSNNVGIKMYYDFDNVYGIYNEE